MYFHIETEYFCKSKLFEIEQFCHLNVCKQNLYLYKTKLFEINSMSNDPKKVKNAVKQPPDKPTNKPTNHQFLFLRLGCRF